MSFGFMSSGFWNLKWITCDCGAGKGQSGGRKGAEQWWNHRQSSNATKQRQEEREMHKKGELKVTVCTWCVPEDVWFTHTSCQSAEGFQMCGGLTGHDGSRRVTWRVYYEEGTPVQMVACSSLGCCSFSNHAGLQPLLQLPKKKVEETLWLRSFQVGNRILSSNC